MSQLSGTTLGKSPQNGPRFGMVSYLLYAEAMDRDPAPRHTALVKTRQVCAASLAMLGALGCELSPKPEPPDADFVFDAERIQVLEGDGPEVPMELRGEPGAASPPGAIIRVYPLGSDLPRLEAEVGVDGGFVFPELPGNEELRIQLLDGAARSEPLDLQPNAEGTRLEPVPRALGECLVLDPPKEIVVSPGSTASVVVRHSCEESVTIAAPELRRPSAGVDLVRGPAWPAVLVRGAELRVEVRLAADAELDEDIFFIEATEPMRDRRPITFRRP